MLCFIVATPISIPTNSVGGFPFLHTLSRFIIYRFFFFFLAVDVLTRVRRYFHCGFDLYFCDN